MNVKLCGCGCGSTPPLAARTNTALGLKKGEPCNFIPGHASRLVRRFGSANGRWKGGRHIARTGYVMVYAPGHLRAGQNGYVLEHILVVESALGKPLRDSAEVHHADLDRANNDRANLVACDSSAYHGLLHKRLRALLACGDPNARRCSICHGYDRQDDFMRQPRHRSCLAEWTAKRKMENAS